MELGARYTNLITAHCPLPTVRSDRTSVYAQYTVFVDNREQVLDTFKTANIPTAVHYPVPLHRQPAYKSDDAGLAQSERVANRVVSLPMGPDLSIADQDRIVEVLKRAVSAGTSTQAA